MTREEERLLHAPDVQELQLGAARAYGGPKKQYVRDYGWRRVIEEFIRVREADGVTQPIKYLTFPGANATDIGILFRSGLLLVYDGKLQVGICDRENALFIQNSLRETVGDVLVATTKELHQALRDENDDLVKSFPFDVINLDFCDTALKCVPQDDSYPNIESLDKIFEYQKGKDFLLLITAREMINVHPDILRVINENMQIVGFRTAYTEVYGGENPNLCVEDITQFSLIIYSKLTAKFAKSYGYKITDKFVAKYARQNGQYHMVTMSFLLESQFQIKSPKRKYEPKFTKRELLLNGNRYPTYMLEKADEQYTHYVVNLLNLREIVNISELLEQNGELAESLEKEEREYDFWWMNVK